MTPVQLDPRLVYALLGVVLFGIGLYGMIIQVHLLRRVVAMNVLGTGAFMTVIALGYRGSEGLADPVPHAIVLTGLVVTVSTTALIVALACRLAEATGEPVLPEGDESLEAGEREKRDES